MNASPRCPEPEYGSDIIASLIADAGIDHVAFNPGATFRGIHDSLVNHLGEERGGPRIALCLHESISVSVAQAYAKACGRPMAVLIHNVVGLQNASMAIYNAWCDRTPMLLIGGTGPLSKAHRRPWIDWIHTANAQAQVVRDYVKWDDQPHDMASVPESFARALRTAVSSPPGPVYLCYDVDLQEEPLPDELRGRPVSVSAYPEPTAPAASETDLDRLADRLRTARMPLIAAGFVGDTDTGMTCLTELAELLAAPVLDAGNRLNFPTAHELNADGAPELLDEADLLLALDVEDVHGTLGGARRLGDGSAPGPVPVVNVTPGHLRARAWSHDYQSFAPATEHLTSASDPVLAGLLTRLRAQGPDPVLLAVRRERLAGQNRARRARWRAEALAATAPDAVPMERLLVELGDALAGTRFILANGSLQRLEHRLWDLSEPRAYLGATGGGGLGHGLGAAIGASLAVGPDTVVVDVQADGDALFTPSALWTMAHLRTPVLVVVHNNRQYGNTVGHAARIAEHRGRPVANRYAGAGLTDPAVDFAELAASYGVWSAGPVQDPEKLREVLRQAVSVVLSGRPALVDVVTPGA
ncbi:thiamine pyrophosphate-binding protein [Streptomyces puniciscabiei]